MEKIIEVIEKDYDLLSQKELLAIAKKLLKEQEESFEESARPLMKYLGENHHPHTSAYVRNDLAELLEGQEVFGTKEYVAD